MPKIFQPKRHDWAQTVSNMLEAPNPKRIEQFKTEITQLLEFHKKGDVNRDVCFEARKKLLKEIHENKKEYTTELDPKESKKCYDGLISKITIQQNTSNEAYGQMIKSASDFITLLETCRTLPNPSSTQKKALIKAAQEAGELWDKGTATIRHLLSTSSVIASGHLKASCLTDMQAAPRVHPSPASPARRGQDGATTYEVMLSNTPKPDLSSTQGLGQSTTYQTMASDKGQSTLPLQQPSPSRKRADASPASTPVDKNPLRKAQAIANTWKKAKKQEPTKSQSSLSPNPTPPPGPPIGQHRAPQKS